MRFEISSKLQMALVLQPKSVRRATSWDTAVEEGKRTEHLVYTLLHLYALSVAQRTVFR